MNTETATTTQTEPAQNSASPKWHSAPASRSLSANDAVYDSMLWRLSTLQTAGQTLALGITGCSAKSGTTTMATKLALQAGMQQVGRVLLIDANWSSPSLKKVLKLAPNSGLYDVLSGEVAPRECEPEQIAQNVFVIPCGEVRSSEGARVDRLLAAEMIEQFRADYDLVIVDLPPARDLRCALPVAKSLDGVLLVTRSEKIKQQEAQRTVKQLQQDDVRILGTILNRHREYVPRWLQKWF